MCVFSLKIVVTHSAALDRDKNLSQKQIVNGVDLQSTRASECVISITKGFVQQPQHHQCDGEGLHL